MIDREDQTDSWKPILRRRLRRAGAVLLIVVGALLLPPMIVAVVTEALLGDFFAVAVAGMVIVFALKLIELGGDIWTGRRRYTAPPPTDPVLDHWLKRPLNEGRPPVDFTDLRKIKRLGAARAALDR